jgi:hypothetical protein
MKTILSLALLLISISLVAAEGKWTPQQVLDLDPAWLREQGLRLPPARLWDPARSTGLLAAAVNIGGCSGGFISPDGLIVTNHHCVFSILQEHSTPQNDLIANGFVARSQDQELRGKTVRVTVPRRFTDVTKIVVDAVPANATDLERAKEIERKQNELVAECEKQPSARCRVAAHDGGVQYVLTDSLELTDVRVVYAPPRSIGEYGGEVDNWMWPRHTGDFSVARAYAEGKPYRPEFYFPVSSAGVKPGDFVMLLGYPGVTYRSLTADEMTERRDYYFTRRRDVYRDWIAILEAVDDPQGKIAVADNLKTLHNRAKNAEGQLAGFRRGNIVEKQRAADEKVLAWAAPNPAHAGAVAAYNELRQLTAEQLRTWDRDFLLDQIRATPSSLSPLGPKALLLAVNVARAAVERNKPDSERDPLYTSREIERTRDRLEREQKNFFALADKRLLASFIQRAKDQRIAALSAPIDIEQLYAQTKLVDLAERLRMFDETVEQLRARRDPLVDLGLALEAELSDYGSRKTRWEGAAGRLRPIWRRAVIAHAGKPVAPDANSTLRVSFAHVKGYEPRDGVFYVPQTTLAGILEKNTGEEPFNAPQRILEAAGKNPDVPVNFLADGDTTGGSSGSPVVNGRGELVGVNFDRVWENVANDFGYNPEIARNISVDVRYLLWILREVEGAPEILSVPLPAARGEGGRRPGEGTFR